MDERLGLMDYGKGKLGIGRSFEFTFDDGTSTYEFPHQSFGHDMVMDGVKYSLVISSGQVQAVVEAQTDHKGNSSNSGTGTTTSTGTKPSGSGTYDPYDAGDYDNAEDFADDHYEDFYDYEDNYEDEDEAYDAAEEEELLDLKTITQNLENNNANIDLTAYEQEQEKKAIISYEQLLKNASNISLSYKEEKANISANILDFIIFFIPLGKLF